MKETSTTMPTAACTTDTGLRDLVERYAPMVRARCARELCPADADDATQAVFLVLWRSPTAPAEGPRLAAWLLGVCRNVIRNARRDAARRLRAERGAGKEIGMIAARMTGEEEDGERVREVLDAALAELPHGEREAVQLYYLAGHTYAEIAKATGAPTSTAAARVRRGLGHLRERLARRGVAVGLALLTGVLSAEGAAAAAPILVDRIVATAPSAGGPSTATAELPAHIHRWSRMGPTLMLRISVLSLAALAAVLLTWRFVPAEDGPPPAVPAIPAVAATPPGTAAAAGAATDAPGDLPGDILCDSAIVLRANDPQRTWARLKASPYGGLLPEAMVAEGDRLMAAMGPGWVILDPASAYPEPTRREMEAMQRRLMTDPSAGTMADETERIMREQQLQQQAEPSTGDLFVDARGHLALKDEAVQDLLVRFLSAWWQPDPTAAPPPGVLHRRHNENGSWAVLRTSAGMDWRSDSNHDDTDLAWLPTVPEPDRPEADLEFAMLLHPRDPAAYAAWSGQAGERIRSAWAHLRVTPTGLRLEAASVTAPKLRTEAPVARLAEAPRLSAADFAAVPADALVAGAYALKPGFAADDPTLVGMLTPMKLLMVPLLAEKPAKITVNATVREGAVVVDTEAGARDGAIEAAAAWQARAATLVEAIEAVLAEATGPALFWIRPGVMVPSFTVQVPTGGAAAARLLAVVRELKPEIPLADDRTLAIRLDPMTVIQFGHRGDRLVLTTEAGGIDAVLALPGGFDTQADVAAALAPLSRATSAHLVLRHRPLAKALLPLTALAPAELQGRLQAFAGTLPEGASWLRWRNDETGANATADGALNALVLPVLVPLVAPALGLPPMLAN